MCPRQTGHIRKPQHLWHGQLPRNPWKETNPTPDTSQDSLSESHIQDRRHSLALPALVEAFQCLFFSKQLFQECLLTPKIYSPDPAEGLCMRQSKDDFALKSKTLPHTSDWAGIILSDRIIPVLSSAFSPHPTHLIHGRIMHSWTQEGWASPAAMGSNFWRSP